MDYFGLHFSADDNSPLQVRIRTDNQEVWARHCPTGGAWSQWRRLDASRDASGMLAETCQLAMNANYALKAGKLANPVRISLSGAISGSSLFDGSGAINIETRADGLELRLASLETRQAGLEQRQGEVEKESKSLDGRLASLESDLASLRLRLESFTTASAELKDGLGQLSGRLGALESRLGQVEGAGDRLTQMEQDISALKSDVATLRSFVFNSTNDNN